MCNAYTVRPKVGARELDQIVSAEIGRLPSPLVRRTAPGVVVLPSDGGLRATIMRWGFQRSFSDAINNARADKLESPTWKEAVESGRCLVPISTFYEWQPLAGKAKQAFEFRRPDREWMWIAGLFEKSDRYGMCYATITTEPAPVAEPIHDRMLAVLDFDDAMAFLRGESIPSQPYQGNLVAEPCESPLKRKSAGVQGDLF